MRLPSRLVHGLVPAPLRRGLRRLLGYEVIRDATRQEDGTSRKRALLVYLPLAFRLADTDPRLLSHQNLRQCRQIAILLGEFGYVVDVADCRDRRIKVKGPYDLVISHRLDWRPPFSVAGRALKVYLASGMDCAVHNRNVRRRLDAIRERRRIYISDCPLHPERYDFLEEADVIVGFGPVSVLDTWRIHFKGPVYGFNNYWLACPRPTVRDEDAARHFLFMGSRNQVRKGLDLLLEVFARHPELHLHVTGHYGDEKEFCRCYEHEMRCCPNIHLHGWVSIDSAEWLALCRQCAFTVLPSCEEGQPGSIIQGMYAGLIPVVTREAGVEVDGFGFYFDSDTLSCIESSLLCLLGLPPQEIRERSRKSMEIAETRYGETVFLDRWRTILTDILEQIPK